VLNALLAAVPTLISWRILYDTVVWVWKTHLGCKDMSFRGIACIYKVVEVLPTSNLISDFPSFR
jgi:hypothetical protein